MRGEFIDVGHERLYYYAAGTRGSGDPVILVHGVPTSSHVWSNLVAQLPAGRRIVVPDLLAHGRSDHGAAADLCIRAHAARLTGLLDVLRIGRCAMVGHHAGALIAGQVAVSNPGRVSHLAMLNPIAGDVTLTGTLAVIRAFLPLTRLVPRSILHAWIRRELCRWFVDQARARLSVDQYVMTLTAPTRWPSFLAQLRALDPREVGDCTDALGRLDIPVAIMAGSDDPAVPRPAIDRLHDVLRHATLDIVRDGRHFTPEESPELVARCVARLLVS
jgi:pimeloyl-ACP methyl ester carboxylesterase